MSELRQRLARLPLERRVQFLALLRGGTDGRVADRPTPRPRGDTAPLSYSQDLLWFLDRLSPGMSAYNVIAAIWLRGHLDVGALRDSLATLVRRHEPLRTSLRESADGPMQVIAAEVPVELPLTVVEGDTPEVRRARGRALLQDRAAAPFDLGAGPLWRAELYRTGEDEHLLAWIVHHSVFDATSSEVFAGELAATYGAAVEHREVHLPELPIQYADFAIWQREWLTGSRLERLTAYWREKLRDLPVLELPTDRPRPEQFTYRGADARKPVAGGLVEAAHRLARELGVTPYPVYVAAFFVLLHRYSQQDDLVVGCSTSVRGRLELEHLIGFFVNMLALRVDVGGDPSFADLVRQVDGVVREAFANVDLPFERVVQAVAPVRDPSRSPVVQVTFLLPQQPQRLRMQGLEVEFEQPPATTSKFDMTWQMYEAGDSSSIDVEYSTDLYDAGTIDGMQTHYVQLLAELVGAPGQPVSQAVILPEADRAELVERWNGLVRPVPETTVDGWFAEVAARAPDAVAVVAGDEQVTYGDLEAAANRLARLLRGHGAGPGERVALCLPRGADYVTAVLATLKAGAAFVPLDPAHPPERILALIADAAPRVVVTHAALTAGFPSRTTDSVQVVELDRAADLLAGHPPTAPAPAADPSDLAYVLYTSGSTGTPKGVLIEHRSVVNFIGSAQRLFELTPADRVLGYASYTFDVSVFEMFAALLTGARLHIALEAERLDVERLQSVLEDGGITVIDLPPTVMALLDPARLDRLRISFVGGEAFPAGLVNAWNKVSRFFNGYGPTECTVTMTVQECEGSWEGSPPIGLPMDNHVAHVLDQHLALVPHGVPGELVIGGAGLARGYLNAPELTGEKFVPDPFGTAPGGRLYRTGDLVRRRRDGAIVFLGRVDRQIKIRGVRIEPGEIEAVLAAVPGVRQGYVEAWADQRGQRHLVAYVGAPGEPPPTAEVLRAHLAERLPAMLVPQYLVVLPALPLTSSGKVDRRALPPPDATARAGGDRITAPRTEAEKILAEEFFGPMLETPDVDVDTSFFELGGSSLQAAQLISKLRRRFDVEIGVADFFRDSTIAGLAVLVERQRAAKLDDDHLLDLLETMSDEDVARFLRSTPEGGS
ncbi:non-ribosomal peptide synthetase [Micromonospora sp. DT229]|uniref:non-ribosomal peptide synthetase n=1 Tax=Micromonospora sp. DT229 TaxID=3393430 RepID=UPI003CF80537